MAGRKKVAATAPTLPSTSLVASAVRYPGKVTGIYVGAKDWQRECYRHFGICGEARYAATYFGHALARCSLFATDKAGRGAVPLPDGKAVDVLDSLFNGSEGQEAMLDMIGQHLTIAGECYLIGREVPVRDEDDELILDTNTGEAATDEVWEILSVLEVKKAGERWSITSKEEGEADIMLNEDAVVIRIWRPNPSRRLEADSPFRSLLPVLREIEWLTLRTFAECRSRLTGAGLMFVSEDVSFPAPPEEINGKKIAPANDAEGMLFVLASAMMGAVEDPSSPESLMPVLATVPSDVWANGGKPAELLKFWTELDSETRPMREAAIHRFALGMDLPPEKILGMGSNAGSGGGTSNGVSHWGAWQIDEETIRLHIEPMLGLVCNALIIGFLRPVTEGMEGIGYDTTNLRLKPDRSKEALELYKMGIVKAEVVLRENGFDPKNDLMGDEERRMWLTVKVATGSATPEQVQKALKALGVDLGTLLAPTATPRETRPDPSLEDHPTRDMPEMSLLMAVCEPLVLRALERVGNKLRQRGKGGVQPSGVKAYEIHTVIAANGTTDTVLEDAFSTAGMCLNGVAPEDIVVPRLEAYVRTLMTKQRPHSRTLLAKALEGIA